MKHAIRFGCLLLIVGLVALLGTTKVANLATAVQEAVPEASVASDQFEFDENVALCGNEMAQAENKENLANLQEEAEVARADSAESRAAPSLSNNAEMKNVATKSHPPDMVQIGQERVAATLLLLENDGIETKWKRQESNNVTNEITV